MVGDRHASIVVRNSSVVLGERLYFVRECDTHVVVGDGQGEGSLVGYGHEGSFVGEGHGRDHARPPPFLMGDICSPKAKGSQLDNLDQYTLS